MKEKNPIPSSKLKDEIDRNKIDKNEQSLYKLTERSTVQLDKWKAIFLETINQYHKKSMISKLVDLI